MKNATFFKTSTLVAACAALMACGGGGDSAPVAPAVVLTNIAAQGLWQNAAGSATDNFTVVTDSGDAWSVLNTAGTQRLVKAMLATSGTGFAGTGKSFLLGTSTVDAVTLNASAVAKTSLNGSISSTAPAESFSLAYQTRYDTAAKLADFVGSWTGALKTASANWSINATGVLTGVSTTGCTYTGQLGLRPEARAVANIAVTQTCAAETKEAPVTQFSGVAFKTTDNKAVTVLLTTADSTQALALKLQ